MGGVVDAATALAAMAASAIGVNMQINEAISQYARDVANINAQSRDRTEEAARRTDISQAEELRVRGQTTTQGVLSLKEVSAQAAFASKQALTAAELNASSEEARLGASGVRAKGSPLLAAQQRVDQGFAQADRVIESGRSRVALGGLQLGGQLSKIASAGTIERSNIAGQQTLVTNEFSRRAAEQITKSAELERRRGALVGVAALGGAGALISSFYTIYQNRNALA